MKINFGRRFIGKGVHVAGCPYSCCKDEPEVVLGDPERRLHLSNNDQLWIATKPIYVYTHSGPRRPHGRYTNILGTGNDAETAERMSAVTVHSLFDEPLSESWEKYQNSIWMYGCPRHLVLPATERLRRQLLAALDDGMPFHRWSGYGFDFAVMPNIDGFLGWINDSNGPKECACTIERALKMVQSGVVGYAEGIGSRPTVSGILKRITNRIGGIFK